MGWTILRLALINLELERERERKFELICDFLWIVGVERTVNWLQSFWKVEWQISRFQNDTRRDTSDNSLSWMKCECGVEQERRLSRPIRSVKRADVSADVRVKDIDLMFIDVVKLHAYWIRRKYYATAKQPKRNFSSDFGTGTQFILFSCVHSHANECYSFDNNNCKIKVSFM